jgi:hypothetical protein
VRYDYAGVKAENVDGLTIRNFTLQWTSAPPDYYRAGIELLGFKNAMIDGFTGSGPSAAAPAIWLHDGAGATVRNVRALHGKPLSAERVTGLETDPEHRTK